MSLFMACPYPDRLTEQNWGDRTDLSCQNWIHRPACHLGAATKTERKTCGSYSSSSRLSVMPLKCAALSILFWFISPKRGIIDLRSAHRNHKKKCVEKL